MAIKVKNDSPRLKGELTKLPALNSGLIDLLNRLSKFVEASFKKDIVITMIYRTDQEQDEIYANDAKYQQKKFKSPHQFWHGVDLRDSIYTQEEKDKMVGWLNSEFNKSNGYKWTSIIHQVGNRGYHFHVQYVKKA